MRYYHDNKQIFGAFKIGGISYPANWLQFATDEEKAAIGIITLQDETPTEKTPLTLAELKAQKISEINFAFEQSMSQVKAGYPQDEILTWSKQESEARAYLADNTADTPLLDSYVVVKSVPKNLLSQAIVAKADAYATICGGLVGKRQYLEDVINNATIEGIANISW